MKDKRRRSNNWKDLILTFIVVLVLTIIAPISVQQENGNQKNSKSIVHAVTIYKTVTDDDIVAIFNIMPNNSSVISTKSAVTLDSEVVTLDPIPLTVTTKSSINKKKIDTDSLKFKKTGYICKDNTPLYKNPKTDSKVCKKLTINKKVKYAYISKKYKNWRAVKTDSKIKFIRKEKLDSEKTIVFDNLNKSNINFANDADGWMNFFMPYAIKVYNKYKILPSVMFAQSAWESGWGQCQAASYNIFGMRSSMTHWLSFKNWYHACMSYGKNLATNRCYRGVSGNKSYVDALSILGVAYSGGNSSYASTMISMIRQYDFDKYDTKEAMDKWVQKHM